MEQIVANLLGKTRRESLGGRPHIVAPMTLIVPGVLNGTQGPLYYPPEEIGKNPSAWNDAPIVVYHPTENGQPVSAKTPSVANRQRVGRVYQARQGDGGKLQAEAWFDVERTRRVDNRVLDALESGKQIELSTGLFTDNKPAENGAAFNGTPYNFTATNYRPDHLAILPDQKGACSLDDGCGVLNKQKKEGSMALSEKEKKAIVDNLIANSCCWDAEERETLNAFDDDKLVSLDKQLKAEQKHEVVINTATKSFEDAQGTTHTYNAKESKWESKAKEPEKKDPPVDNKQKPPQTTKEFLDAAPPEIRSTIENAMAIEQQAKVEIVHKLVANLETNEEKTAMGDELIKEPLANLQRMFLLLPKEKAAPKPAHNWAGASTPSPIDNSSEPFAEFGLPDEYMEREKVEA